MCVCEKLFILITFQQCFFLYFVHFVTTHIHFGVGITIISIIGNEQNEVKITYLLNKIRFGGNCKLYLLLVSYKRWIRNLFNSLKINHLEFAPKKRENLTNSIQSNNNSTCEKIQLHSNIKIKFRSIKTWQWLSEMMCHQAFPTNYDEWL